MEKGKLKNDIRSILGILVAFLVVYGIFKLSLLLINLLTN
jgi:hypothetical protein